MPIIRWNSCFWKNRNPWMKCVRDPFSPLFLFWQNSQKNTCLQKHVHDTMFEKTTKMWFLKSFFRAHEYNHDFNKHNFCIAIPCKNTHLFIVVFLNFRVSNARHEMTFTECPWWNLCVWWSMTHISWIEIVCDPYSGLFLHYSSQKVALWKLNMWCFCVFNSFKNKK